MEFKFDTSDWIQDLEGFLFEKKINYSQMKGSLRAADLSKISFADYAKLYSMFDPSAKLSFDVFVKELELYFKLKKDKNFSNGLPVFSNYVEWVINQNPKRFDGNTLKFLFDKSTEFNENEMPDCLKHFKQNLPEAFNVSVDKITNGKLNAFIDILQKMNQKYVDLPVECKGFIKTLYHCCAVREEISRRNRFKFSRLCDNQEQFYDIINKGFSGRSIYDEWIDAPSKNLTLKNMINYSNYQNVMLNYINSDDCVRIAGQLFEKMKLPYLPEPYDDHYNEVYLKQTRDYKNYQVKMAPFFKELISRGLDNLIPYIADDRKKAISSLSSFVKTDEMIYKLKKIQNLSNEEFYQQCAFLLSDIVNLDKIFSVPNKDLFDLKKIKEKFANYYPLQQQIDNF